MSYDSMRGMLSVIASGEGELPTVNDAEGNLVDLSGDIG